MGVERVGIGGIEVRQATPDDIESLIDLCRQGFPGTLLWNGPRFLSRRWWRVALRSSSAETWLFSVGNEPSGVCILVLDMDTWQAEIRPAWGSLAVRLGVAVSCPKVVASRLAQRIHAARSVPPECPRSDAVAAFAGSRVALKYLTVAPRRRKQGIGTKILQFCENRTLELGREAIEFFVLWDNIPARRLYAQQGYVCTDHGRRGCVFTKVLDTSILLPARVNENQ